jgi:biotin-(acetyl-CoA carboxylase) ligase
MKKRKKIIEIYKSSVIPRKEYICLWKRYKGYYAIAKDMDLDGGLILKRENKILEKIYCGEISIRERKMKQICISDYNFNNFSEFSKLLITCNKS